MSLMQPLIEEWTQESVATRRVLERVPADQLQFKPGEKAPTLGALAYHTALNPGGIMQMIQADSIDMLSREGDDFKQPDDVAEIMSTFEQSHATGLDLMGKMTDEQAMGSFRFMAGDNLMMECPRIACVRMIGLSHTYHHRGQLTTYLRCIGVPVPAVYGMSADENPFAEMMGM